MQFVKHAIISAAGLGSRLGLNIPKCLVKIGPKRLIDYQLDLLKDVPDVRIIVGFKENEVIEYVKNIRNDVIFVRNPDYHTTSNSYSVYLATKDLKEPYVSIDGDLLINRDDFESFLQECVNGHSIVGITESKTEEAVFVELDQEKKNILKFQFNPKTDYEWCGIAYLNNITIQKNGKFMFGEIEKHLPLRVKTIRCFEIDTEDDLELAIKNFNTLGYKF